jgi:L-2-hydroxyglutarate oxidase LhgO
LEKIDVTIIGAGVVGLAVAAEVSRKDLDVYVLEMEENYGLGTSSRNSEVIHAGIYYPPGSLKARLCVRGNELLYRICENGVPHKKIGKIIVATKDEEIEVLEELFAQGQECGARDLEMIYEDRIKELEPEVRAVAAIHSPSTGIIDAHGLMDYFYRSARRKSSLDPLVLKTEVRGIEQVGDGYVVEMNSGGEPFQVESRIVINAAGLFADRVAEMVGLDIEKERYRLHWCKGDYFSLGGIPPVRMLVYPVPPQDGVSLGIHTVPDLGGRLKFGPNAFYLDKIDYAVESNRDDFWKDIISYIPFIEREKLHPDMSGIRAKLQGPGDSFRDFVIAHEEDKGFPGLINLIGIESPGLTCAPAIGEYVKKITDEIL